VRRQGILAVSDEAVRFTTICGVKSSPWYFCPQRFFDRPSRSLGQLHEPRLIKRDTEARPWGNPSEPVVDG
jgi:hypothetical protein